MRGSPDQTGTAAEAPRPISVCYLLALATVAVAPNQYLGTITRAGLRLTPADILLGLTLIAFIIESWRRRSRIIWPPAVLWALVAVAAASALAASPLALGRVARPDWLRAVVRESAQLVEWFLVAYLILRNTFDSWQRVRTAVWVLASATAAVAIFAFWQRLSSVELGQVSASFGTLGRRSFHPSPHAYGAYQAMAVPVMVGLVGALGQPGRRRSSLRLGLSLLLVVLAALGVATITTGGALAAVVIGLAAAIAVSGRRSPAVTAAVVALVIGVLPWRLIAAGDVSLEELGNFSQGGGVRRLYSEWQAGLNMLEWNFPTGVGIGNYQSNIYEYYFGLPYQEQLKPDSLNGYLVLASTGGWLALAMLMAALACFGRLAIGTARSAPTAARAGLAAGLAGALAGFLAAQVYSSLLVRGTGLVFGLILALIAALASQKGEEDEAQPSAQHS